MKSLLLFSAAGVAFSCAGSPTRSAPARAKEPRTSLSLFVAGDDRVGAAVRQTILAAGVPPFTVRAASIPNVAQAAPEKPTELLAVLAGARREYVDGRFRRCLERLADDTTVVDLLGKGRPDIARRVLFWRVACHVGTGDLSRARREADRMAELGLESPPDVETASPEVEAIVVAAQRKAAKRKRVALEVRSEVAGPAVSVDGRPAGCVTPCTVDAVPGDHVVTIAADGILPSYKVVRLGSSPNRVHLKAGAAPPELAAKQWSRRFAGSAEIDSAPSLRLLTHAVRDRRLLFIVAEPFADGARLRGSLAVDGKVTARGERATRTASEISDQARGLVQDLLVQGQLVSPGPPLHRRPAFWIATGATAAVASALVYLLVREPPTRTEVFLGNSAAP